MKPFSVGGIISLSWEAFKHHWGILLGIIAISVALNMSLSYVSSQTPESEASMILLIALVSVVVSMIVKLGILRITLNIVDGAPTAFDQLFGEAALLWRYFAASVLYGIMVFIGFICFIIPGVYLAIMYGQYQYALVDKRVGILESLSMSAKLTKGSRGLLFLAGLAILGLILVSIIPLGLGLFVTVPMSMVAGPFMYRALTRAHEGAGREAVTDAAMNAAPNAFVPLDQANQPVPQPQPETGARQ